jgi:hypothetical protein
MKKISLIISAFVISYASMAQCATSTGGSITATGNTSTVRVNYISGPSGFLQIDIKCGFYTLRSECFLTSGNGTITIPNISCGGGTSNVTAVATGHAGDCNGPICSQVLILPPGGGPLPIVLNSFSGKRNGSTVNIDWKSESELNSRSYILERKVGKDFIPVTTVPTTDKSTGSAYSFIDKNNEAGISQYRLKMLDLNGDFKYSKVVSVNGISAGADFSIFPNPSTGNATVAITDITESIDVQLVDLSGRIIKTIPANNNNLIPLSGLQKGMYFVKMINRTNGNIITKKLAVN